MNRNIEILLPINRRFMRGTFCKKKFAFFPLMFLSFYLHINSSQAEVKVVTSDISAKRHNISFSSQGFIQARQETNISSQVSGQVTVISPQFDVGQKVKKGELLFSVDSADYKVLVANAKQILADAALSLEDEKARAKRAKRNWSKTQSTKPTALVGRDLHVLAAQARYDAAKSNFTKAQRDLERTHVTVPYDGIVQQRQISIGSYVQVGTATGVIVQQNSAVIDLPIAPHYANKIASLEKLKIRLKTINSLDTEQSWPAKAMAFSPSLNDQDQRLLLRAHVQLNNGSLTSQLFINQYVVANLTISNDQLLFAIPELAFTQRNSILSVKDGVIKELYPTVIYQYEGKKYCLLDNNETLTVVTEKPDLLWSGAKAESLATLHP